MIHPVCSRQDGNFYRDNLRTAKAEFTYISDGIPKYVQPHFTYYGFRYVFSGTACFNMDSYNFLRKFSHDLYETQKEYGHVTAVVPAFHENGPTCSVWGDAATIVPWNLYLYYGDINILKEQFESMRQWVDYIKGIDELTGGRRLWDVGFHFGDWLALDGEGATTIWERWNSILLDGKISGTEMNSLNHHSYGSVVEWMYRNMAGLHVEEENPGFTHVTIAPQPDYRITFCAMKYQSAAGTYEYAYMPEVPILKIYSSKSPLCELLESETAKSVVESFVPEWRAIPAGMHDMTVEMLNDTPFVNLTPEQMEAFDTHLKNC